MEEKGKKGFYTVQEPDMKDYKQKIKKHRLRILRRTAIAITAVLLIIIGVGLFMAFRHYENFDIRSSVERSDTAATHFKEFHGNILKYSNDGAFYTDRQNELIWNQTYEMSDPRLDICENYLTIYDKKGTKIYILTPEGLVGSIETTMPVEQVCIASQGTIAVLMYKDSAGYLAMYDKDGNNLAMGAIHGEKGGYPIAIGLSYDAIKLAVSTLDINDGSVKSTVAFYNFGSVGQNVTDHCVGANSFAGMVVTELKFLSNDCMAALGDSELMIFEGTQKPQITTEISLEKQAKSIFYDNKHIGVVTSNGDEDVTHHIVVYDLKGNIVMEKDFEMEYTSIEFLSNDEICIMNGNTCDIYTSRGIYKFHYQFDTEIYKVIPGLSGLNYTFILNDRTENVRLR